MDDQQDISRYSENETINAERAEARELRKAWIELDIKCRELERRLRDWEPVRPCDFKTI